MSNEPSAADAQDIWETWHRVHRPNRKIRALPLQRLEIINAAIISYGKETCIKTIIGSQYSEWHMGGNPAGKQYTSIELLLRVSKKPEDQARNERRIRNLCKLADQKKDGDG